MRKTLLPLFALCGAFIFQEESFAQSSYSMNIDISEQASVSLTNYQVDLTLNTEALILAGKMNVDGSDMRFYEDSCLSTPIDHWVESGINSTSTLVWVRVPSIPANTVTSIYMAYGDPSATDASNFAATFPNAIISAGSSINLTGNVIADWFQIDAGDTLSVVSGAPLTINSRKIIINGVVLGDGAGYAGGALVSGGQAGFGPGGGLPSPTQNSGSGGGSYAGVGGTGGFDSGDTPGVGGPIYGTDSGADFDMGSGGASTSANFGGNGGGGFAINAEYISITGTISMNGTSAQQPGGGQGGGGGAGGSVVAIGKDITFSGTITANGGSGAVGTSTANDDGGSGAGGRIKFLYTGTLSNTGTTSVVGGPVGTNGTGGVPTIGGSGVVFEGAMIALDDLIISNGNEIDYNFTPAINVSGLLCDGETVTLSAAGSYSSYLWVPSGETTSSIDVTSTLVYTLTAGIPGTPAACNFTQSVDITVVFNPIPVVDLGLTDTICEAESVTLDAGSGFSSYDWSTGSSAQTETLTGITLGLGTHIISVEVMDANGCIGSDEIEILVEDCTIGLDETELTNVFEVYPNPVTEKLFVKLESTDDLPSALFISDMSGKRVYSQANFNANTSQMINVSGLEAGTYFVEISNSKGRATRMIVKN